MTIFIWANIYCIWINEFQNRYSLQRHSANNTSLRISREIPRNQLWYLKVIGLDQHSLYGGWYTQVNDRFQERKTF